MPVNPALEALRQSIAALQQRLAQIEQHDPLSRADTDVLLQHLRELYAKGLDLQEHAAHERGAGPEDLASPSGKADSADTTSSAGYDSEEIEGPAAAASTDNTSASAEPAPPEAEDGDPGTAHPYPSAGDAESQADDGLETAEDDQPEAPGNSYDVPDYKESDPAEPADAPASPEADEQPYRTQAIHEKFEGQRPSLHEQLMATNSGRSLADQFKNAPITDLRSAVGLNDRIKFIRELFQGSRDAYFHTIDRLNQSSSYEEAVVYLEHEIKEAYGWHEENETVQAFMELVYRRFLDSASQV